MTEPKINIKKPYVWIATWFGFGFMKPAPGTWGSFAALPFGIFIFLLGGPILLIIATALLAVIGMRATDIFERETGTTDNSIIVIDEVAGQWIAILPALAFHGLNPLYVAIGFILFRALDIIKPWPIFWLDKNIHGGLGVMLDDIVAGFFAALLLTGIIYAGLG